MTLSKKCLHAMARAAVAALFAGPALPSAAVEADTLRAARPAARVADAMMLDAARAGARIVAVGEHGYIALSDDEGKTQRQARNVPTDLTLTAVSFADARNGWAVGHGGVIVHTTDGGEHWELQRRDAAVDQPLLTVHFSDAQNGWAAGLWSLLLATRDGGLTWSPIALPAPEGAKRADLNLLKIFPSAQRLFIAAEHGMVLRSDDGGASWQYLKTGSKASLWSGASSAGGTLLVGGLGGKLLRSADAGASWQAVDSGGAASVTQVRADRKGFWASALDGRLLRSTDDGLSWSVAAVASVPLTAIVGRADGSYLRYAKTGTLK